MHNYIIIQGIRKTIKLILAKMFVTIANKDYSMLEMQI